MFQLLFSSSIALSKWHLVPSSALWFTMFWVQSDRFPSSVTSLSSVESYSVSTPVTGTVYGCTTGARKRSQQLRSRERERRGRHIFPGRGGGVVGGRM
jgi:hypothetical protein